MAVSTPMMVTFLIYIFGMILIGFVAWRSTKNFDDYILGGRSLGPFVTALSAGASDMSGWLLMGQPAVALMGGLVGFLRYNYNPASVFLGDSGSMFIGYVLATLALSSHSADSMLVSIVVPLLAMGVPIFDTSLAIVRRSIRHLLRKEGTSTGNDKVMTADTDHLHHRILRATGLNQRRTAWILYGIALAAVLFGLVAMSLQSRAGGLWLAAVAFAAVVIFKDATIELFDAGRLLNRVAHLEDSESRRRLAVWTLPFYVVFWRWWGSVSSARMRSDFILTNTRCAPTCRSVSSRSSSSSSFLGPIERFGHAP